jgi:hypothetical protein
MTNIETFVVTTRNSAYTLEKEIHSLGRPKWFIIHDGKRKRILKILPTDDRQEYFTAGDQSSAEIERELQRNRIIWFSHSSHSPLGKREHLIGHTSQIMKVARIVEGETELRRVA